MIQTTRSCSVSQGKGFRRREVVSCIGDRDFQTTRSCTYHVMGTDSNDKKQYRIFCTVVRMARSSIVSWGRLFRQREVVSCLGDGDSDKERQYHVLGGDSDDKNQQYVLGGDSDYTISSMSWLVIQTTKMSSMSWVVIQMTKMSSTSWLVIQTTKMSSMSW